MKILRIDGNAPGADLQTRTCDGFLQTRVDATTFVEGYVVSATKREGKNGKWSRKCPEATLLRKRAEARRAKNEKERKDKKVRDSLKNTRRRGSSLMGDISVL